MIARCTKSCCPEQPSPEFLQSMPSSIPRHTHLQDSSFLGGRSVTSSGRLCRALASVDNGIMATDTNTLHLVVHVLQGCLPAAAFTDQLETSSFLSVIYSTSSYLIQRVDLQVSSEHHHLSPSVTIPHM